MTTIQRLDDVFDAIVQDHKQLRGRFQNSFDEVDLDKVTVDQYPLLYAQVVSAIIDKSEVEFEYEVVVATLMMEKQTPTLNDIYNETQLILADVIAMLHLQANLLPEDERFVIDFPVNGQPLTGRFSNLLAGWGAQVSIRVPLPVNLCDAAFDTITPPSPFLGLPVVVTDGDGTTHEVAAGGTYTCIPALPPSGIVYQRPTIGIDERSVYRLGDQRWQFENGLLPYPDPPVNPERVATAAIDNTYDTDFRSYGLLRNENAFGNKYRWTNTAGKQGSRSTQNYTQPQFHYLYDWDDAIHGYVIDHLTGLAWTAYAVNPPNGNRTTSTLTHDGVVYTRAYYDWQSFANYAHGLNGEVQFERGGYRDWRVPTIHELMSLFVAAHGTQFGYAWSGVGSVFDDEALNDWYNVRGETGNPPRSGSSSAWSSSRWTSDYYAYVNNYVEGNQLATSTSVVGVLVRNHY